MGKCSRGLYCAYWSSFIKYIFQYHTFFSTTPQEQKHALGHDVSNADLGKNENSDSLSSFPQDNGVSYPNIIGEPPVERV